MELCMAVKGRREAGFLETGSQYYPAKPALLVLIGARLPSGLLSHDPVLIAPEYHQRRGGPQAMANDIGYFRDRVKRPNPEEQAKLRDLWRQPVPGRPIWYRH